MYRKTIYAVGHILLCVFALLLLLCIPAGAAQEGYTLILQCDLPDGTAAADCGIKMQNAATGEYIYGAETIYPFAAEDGVSGRLLLEDLPGGEYQMEVYQKTENFDWILRLTASVVLRDGNCTVDGKLHTGNTLTMRIKLSDELVLPQLYPHQAAAFGRGGGALIPLLLTIIAYSIWKYYKIARA